MIYKNGEYIIVEAEDLEAAKEIIQTRKKENREFDSIIISMTFKKEELFSFLEELNDSGFIGEIAISGAAELEDEIIKKALALKVRKFLTKPYKEVEVKNFL